MPQKHIECFRLLLEHLAWIEHQFLSGIRDSRKAGSLWGMIWGVAEVRKSIHQRWLAKGLGLYITLIAVPISYDDNHKFKGCPRGVMVKAMNCGIVVREFVLQSRYYVHFRANTLGKGMNPLILPPAMDK